MLGDDEPQPYATARGMLFAAVATPGPLVFGREGVPTWAWVAAGVAATLFLLSAVLFGARPRGARWLATLGVGTLCALIAPALVDKPATALLAALVAVSLLALLWNVGSFILEIARIRRRPLQDGLAQGAALVALGTCLHWALWTPEQPPLQGLALPWSVTVSSISALVWALPKIHQRSAAAGVVLGSLGLLAVTTVLAWDRPLWTVGAAFLFALTTVIATHRRRRRFEQTSWWEPLVGHPERLFVGTFAGLCILGTMLLALPQSSSEVGRVSLIDAAFTATSAVCVTGLIVLDTAVDFSGWGQFVIMTLIQVGGLGIMTFATAAVWLLGRRMSLRHEGAVASLISTQDRGRLFGTAKRVLTLTVAIEGMGATILCVSFMLEGDGAGAALWRALFTAVSAFCNAGFALQSDSLIPYQSSPLVLHAVGVLIVLGGLSPLVVFQLPAVLRRTPRPLSAQVRLALWSAGLLLLGGFFFFVTFEWNGSLDQLSFADKLHNAWFQSVTLRTAGFNSIDLVPVGAETLLLMMVWMFIGGTPGSTAGGVKTTTVAVLLLSVAQTIRGHEHLVVFKRRISESTRHKASVVLSVAVVVGLVATTATLLTQRMGVQLAVFEVVSALGTVGLSLGGTAELDDVGKVIIIACMFVGRVGGLTMLMFLSNRHAESRMDRPIEDVDVG